jgi:hypothetical protein
VHPSDVASAHVQQAWSFRGLFAGDTPHHEANITALLASAKLRDEALVERRGVEAETLATADACPAAEDLAAAAVACTEPRQHTLGRADR